MKNVLTALLIGAAALFSSCGGSSSTSPTTTAPILVTEILTGTVQAPVNGVLQTAFKPFTVGQAGGEVDVTLTSAVETLPDGSSLTTIPMGVGVGQLTNSTTCTLIANASVIAQGGSSIILSGSLSTGSYCVQISDVTSQVGPVAFAIAVAHP